MWPKFEFNIKQTNQQSGLEVPQIRIHFVQTKNTSGWKVTDIRFFVYLFKKEKKTHIGLVGDTKSNLFVFLKNENEQKNKTRNTNTPQQQKNTHTSGLDVTDIRISVCLFKKQKKELVWMWPKFEFVVFKTKHKSGVWRPKFEFKYSKHKQESGLDATRIRLLCFQQTKYVTQIRIFKYKQKQQKPGLEVT